MLARADARRARRLRAATAIQTAFRRHVARTRYLRIRAAVLTIQAACRGKSARAEALELRCLACSSLKHDTARDQQRSSLPCLSRLASHLLCCTASLQSAAGAASKYPFAMMPPSMMPAQPT